MKISQIFEEITNLAETANRQVYLVGGGVRDLLLKGMLASSEYDLVINQGAKSFAELVQKRCGGELKYFEKFLTAKLTLEDGLELDFAEFRKETYERPGALPTVEQGDLSSDLLRRDFSINALLLPVIDIEAHNFDNIIDQHNGLADLKERKIRVLHEKSFLDDPTRIYRAVRYKHAIYGQYEEGTEELMAQAIAAGALDTVEPYRIKKEFKKIKLHRNSHAITEEFEALGVPLS